MLRHRAWRFAACVVIWLYGAVGCATERPEMTTEVTRHQEPPPGVEVGPDAPWPLWPQRMRVHPLSQLVPDQNSGKPLIEARVEFTDPAGNTCKSVGLIDIDLHDKASDEYKSKPVASWSANLWDLAVNRDRYDEVTRTYLFTLKLEDHPVPQEPELRVYFLSGDGKRLQASYSLRRHEGS
jgi:hypothetical protein